MGRRTNRSAVTIPGFSLGFIIAALFGLKRDLEHDAKRVSRRLRPKFEGLDNIPARGPLALVPNHYGRSDFHVFWTMFAITNAVISRRDPSLSRNERVPTWLSQDQWPRQENGVARPDRFSRWLFRRVLKMYDFIPHSPMPEDQSARAAALHTLVGRSTGRGAGQDGKPQPVGIFPEGTTSTNQTLLVPRAGAGTSLGLLARAGVPLLPIAIHEDGNQYVARFGPVYTLDRDAGGRDKEARDRAWATEAMQRIAAMMPPGQRGPYAETRQETDVVS